MQEGNQLRQQAERLMLYRRVFGTEDGEKVLEDLQRTHHMFTPTFNAGDTSPNECFIREGERIVILRIREMKTRDPQPYIDQANQIEKEMANENTL